MKKLYMVVGISGYQHECWWLVRGFLDEAKAIELRGTLESKARELGLYEGNVAVIKMDGDGYPTKDSIQEMWDAADKLREFDAGCVSDTSGICYRIQRCELGDE